MRGGGVDASPGVEGKYVAQVTRWIDQLTRNATCQGISVDTSMRMMSIDRRVVRVIPPDSDFVRVRTRLDLRMGHIRIRSIHQLTTTRPVAISRTNGACSAKKTSPPLPRT